MIKNSVIYKGVRNLYYFSKTRLNEYKIYYRTKSIRAFKDLNKGQKCFIIGNGPSLKADDLEMLHKNKIKTFACNRIYLIFDKTNWRPDYYFISDEVFVNNDNIDSVIGNNISKFFPLKFADKIESANSYFYNTYQFDYENEGKFSTDASKGVYPAGTITSEMIQFAYYMGFTEVYLLGIDFSFISSNSDKDINHFTDKYSSKADGLKPLNVQANLNGYTAARKQYEVDKRLIYNATRGGKLEVFERKDFDILLNNINN